MAGLGGTVVGAFGRETRDMARGHIRKRGNGYAVVVELPRDPVTKKRRQKWLRAESKRAAERLLAETIREVDRGTYVEPTTVTVGEYLEHWLTSVESTVRPSSFRRFVEIVRGRITPEIGAI